MKLDGSYLFQTCTPDSSRVSSVLLTDRIAFRWWGVRNGHDNLHPFQPYSLHHPNHRPQPHGSRQRQRLHRWRWSWWPWYVFVCYVGLFGLYVSMFNERLSCINTLQLLLLPLYCLSYVALLRFKLKFKLCWV